LLEPSEGEWGQVERMTNSIAGKVEEWGGVGAFVRDDEN
jgi:hypothetical protein